MDKANNIDCWQRLEIVIKWANMSTNFFARHIGLSRPDIFYHIKSGKGNLSQNLARRIVDRFPEISIAWLLTGEGEMLGTPPNSYRIPYYEGNVTGNILFEQQEITPSQYFHIPLIGDCDCALRSYDDAMASDIMPGSIIFLKKIDTTAIIPGGIYVIVTSNFILLRRVHLLHDNNTPVLRLECSNNKFTEISIAESEVKEIYRVISSLQLF